MADYKPIRVNPIITDPEMSFVTGARDTPLMEQYDNAEAPVANADARGLFTSLYENKMIVLIVVVIIIIILIIAYVIYKKDPTNHSEQKQQSASQQLPQQPLPQSQQSQQQLPSQQLPQQQPIENAESMKGPKKVYSKESVSKILDRAKSAKMETSKKSEKLHKEVDEYYKNVESADEDVPANEDYKQVNKLPKSTEGNEMTDNIISDLSMESGNQLHDNSVMHVAKQQEQSIAKEPSEKQYVITNSNSDSNGWGEDDEDNTD